MSRKSEFVATVTKSGYKPAQVTVTHKVASAGAAGVAGNVIIGGLIGIGVDTYTGAAMDLVPNPVQLSLEPVDPPVKVASAPVNASTTSAPTQASGQPTLVSGASKSCGVVRQNNGTSRLIPC